MNIEEVRDYCLKKNGVTEAFPFDNETLVFKVMGKIFLLMNLSSQPFRVNLKMNAELAIQYREKYFDVQPGYHMNKKLWNSVYFATGNIPHRELIWMMDHSYNEVIKGLSKKTQLELKIAL